MMMTHDDKNIYEIARDPDTPIVRLEEFVNNQNEQVKAAVASNPKCPGYLLRRIVCGKHNYLNKMLYYNAIMNDNCDYGDIATFYFAINERMGLIAESDVYMYEDILEKILKVASEPKCPMKTLQQLRLVKDRTHRVIFLNTVDDYLIGNIRKYERIISRNASRAIARRIREYKKRGYSIPTPEVPEDETLRQKREELEKQKRIDEAKKARLANVRALIIENLKNTKKLVEEIEDTEIEESIGLSRIPKIRLPESEIIIEVDDHREVNPIYLEYIDFIDFSFIKSDNLKVSGIDWSRTNLVVDPQKVYKKDLSNARFGDHNITFKWFDGCDLRGCDISHEFDSIGIDNALVDENTVVPGVQAKIR